MKEIRVALIGTGVIAHWHIHLYQQIPGVKVVAVSDLIEDKRIQFCDKYNIPDHYADFREMLRRDDIDCVDVCVHNNLHAPLAVAVMAAGKHCYCEKPMAGSYVDAVAMLEASRHYGVKLHIQLGLLYGSSMIAAKRFIDDGLLGKIYHARSYGYRRTGRPFVDGFAEKEFVSSYWAGHGALFDMGVYHISQLLYLMNMPSVTRISGSIYQELPMDESRRQESNYDVEELGVGLVKFQGGLTMSILEAWAVEGAEFPLSSVHGSNGGLQFMEHGDSKKLKFLHRINGYAAESMIDIQSKDSPEKRFDPKRQHFENSAAHWIASLRGEIEPIDTAQLALQTMLISDGIFLSSTLDREVTVDEIPELSRSMAIQEQAAPFGKIVYPPYPFY